MSYYPIVAEFTGDFLVGAQVKFCLTQGTSCGSEPNMKLVVFLLQQTDLFEVRAIEKSRA